jgi:hypothetical protein
VPDYTSIVLKKNMEALNVGMMPYLKRGIESILAKI